MAKLKLGAIVDDKPVKLTIELRQPCIVIGFLGLKSSREGGQSAHDPAKLIAPILARFMATDRAFARSRKTDWGHRRDSVRQ